MAEPVDPTADTERITRSQGKRRYLSACQKIQRERDHYRRALEAIARDPCQSPLASCAETALEFKAPDWEEIP